MEAEKVKVPKLKEHVANSKRTDNEVKSTWWIHSSGGEIGTIDVQERQ